MKLRWTAGTPGVAGLLLIASAGAGAFHGFDGIGGFGGGTAATDFALAHDGSAFGSGFGFGLGSGVGFRAFPPSLALPEGLGDGIRVSLLGHGGFGSGSGLLDVALVQPELRGGFTGPGIASLLASGGHANLGGLHCSQAVNEVMVERQTDHPRAVLAGLRGDTPGLTVEPSPSGGLSATIGPVRHRAEVETAGCELMRELGFQLPDASG